MMNSQITIASFAKKLVQREFGAFFIYPMHDQTIEAIWQDVKHRELLDQMLDDATVSDEAKFLACEVFFKKDILFLQKHSAIKVAEIYTNALRKDFTGMANSWGLLYEHEDAGTVGIAFLTIGEKAVPSLYTLLDDECTHLCYQGSLEATVGNGYGYRIKDFAAYYIGRIIDISLKYYANLADRDNQIEQLKKELERRKLNSRLTQ